MPTTFIAVQCFECSTMQVKQEKKSSNKWSCVVCNQKQSVRKVFAQASMARDVRKFVQSFNMSRQFSDLNHSDDLDHTSNSPIDQPKKTKRNDWTEYVDDDGQDEYCGKFHVDDEDRLQDDEPVIVTEMPKALLKKPKVKNYSSNRCSTEKLFKPLFPDRSNAKRHQNNRSRDFSADIHLAEFEQTSDYYTMRAQSMESTPSNQSDLAHKWNHFRAQIQDSKTNLTNKEEPFVQKPKNEIKGSFSKWNSYITQDDDENTAVEEPKVRLHTAKGQVSKWSSFITEENDNDLENIGMGDSCVTNQRSNIDPLELSMNDGRVEDDIHPDFL